MVAPAQTPASQRRGLRACHQQRSASVSDPSARVLGPARFPRRRTATPPSATSSACPVGGGCDLDLVLEEQSRHVPGIGSRSHHISCAPLDRSASSRRGNSAIILSTFPSDNTTSTAISVPDVGRRRSNRVRTCRRRIRRTLGQDQMRGARHRLNCSVPVQRRAVGLA